MTGSDLSKTPLRHEECVEIVSEAVAKDAPASRLLIEANTQLITWEIQQGAGVVSSFPRCVNIQMTNVCNARCRFCNYVPGAEKPWFLPLETLEQSDWLRFASSLVLNSGLSETFVHPQMQGFLEYASNKLPFISLMVTTNGALLTDKICPAVVRCMNWIDISLNAVRKGTYEHIMTPLKHENTIANIRRLNEEIVKQGADLRTQVSYIAFKGNIDEMPELPALLASLGFKGGIKVGLMLTANFKPQLADRMIPADQNLHYHPELFDRRMRETIDEAKRFGFRVKHPPFFGEKDGLVGSNLQIVEGRDELTSQEEEKVAQAAADRKAELESQCASSKEGSLCTLPWRCLYVDKYLRMRVCCGFCTFLPQFTWTNSKEFHEKSGWNHPYLQYIRGRMYKSDELPFCRFCRTLDKRDPKNLKIRKAASVRTVQMLKEITDRAYDGERRGRINDVGDLNFLDLLNLHKRRRLARGTRLRKAWELTKHYLRKALRGGQTTGDGTDPFGGGRLRRAFHRGKYYYRDIIRSNGFTNAGTVLDVECGFGEWTVFLAEFNDRVYGLACKDGALKIGRGLAAFCDLPNITFVRGSPWAIPLEDESVDAVWCYGALQHVPRGTSLAEIHRVLKPGGRVFIGAYWCVGRLMELFLEGYRQGGRENRRTARSLDTMHHGPLFDGNPNFCTLSAIEDVLGTRGFSLDGNDSLTVHKIGRRDDIPDEVFQDIDSIWRRLAADDSWVAELDGNQHLLDGLARTMDIVAVKRERMTR